ncbi:hypothetical protein A1359_12930 [Methylomonas lenta]|uniref:Uncharacterized protein n=1 Tax=Methylomonas lenta TaxID=980561 RepID=A0A177N5M0_9GAMM|nr:hypothetical protein [Methylomonas lenta]OAI13131.1 hypothetical protein A1359_12930 [Methylomonas lenta]
MKFVKACEKKFNIGDGCNTLQLGTFQYYREMDPDFSIADSSEGTIRYHLNVPDSNPIFLTDSQYNSMTGGHATIGNGSSKSRPHGSLSYILNGGKMEMQPNGINFSGRLDIEYRHPNPFLYCFSAIEDISTYNPVEVDKKYDSYYEINSTKINEFISFLSNCLLTQLTIENIDFGMLDNDVPIGIFQNGFGVKPILQEIKYLSKAPTVVESGQDLDENGVESRFISSCFEKDLSYKSDREYRIVFFIILNGYGVVPMKKQPKLININPFSDFVSP